MTLRSEIERMLDVFGSDPSAALFRVVETIYLIVTSPEFAAQS